MTFSISIMILVGMILLAASLKPLSDILMELGDGRLHRTWRILGALIILFMVGYGVFGTLILVIKGNSIEEIVVSTILLGGGVFVFLVVQLSALTTRDIIRIAKLERDVIRDPLTGMFNRRYLDEMIVAEVAIARRANRSLSALMIDLDHFKHVNDAYGHPVGDFVLRHVARLILRCCRSTERVVRYGGEEFLIIAIDSDIADVTVLGERIVQEIACDCIILPNGISLKITASIGAVSLIEGEDQNDLIERADGALFAAKRGGRNRFCSGI